ncbi:MULTISPECIES: DUF262 domain-containing protein [Pseudomonas]|uniref:GmrSD restriction endonucleases N-terminal domain-containing protein n=1 Tax=Pseudomonas fluorescens TaxID=294 RepID=A0A166QKY2_PSEFL|nr:MULTISPECIES: DUF262 domain-containing protein [Pseudomonas]KZN20444.1 hypothetical protein A1D17_02575 [Pseudomonas fluorescens]
MQTASRHPTRRFFGQSMQTSLGGMYSERKRLGEVLDSWGYTGRRVLGYKLPSWQRPEVWSDEQCTKFIESIWLGVGLGTFQVNDSPKTALSLILLDGQQRLRAIERYWNGDFAILGEDGVAYLWSELTDQEHRHFYRIPFPWVETRYSSEDELRAAYDRHNFGGTAHTADQRANSPS